MSIFESLAQKGISLVEGIGKGVQYVGTRAGKVPVQWPHDKRPGLVWRIPEPEGTPERVTTASIFSHSQPVLVREYEHALVLDNGRLYAELPAGVYDLTKVRIKGMIEVIWVSLNQSKHRWGVGNVMSVDGVTVGAYGELFLQVSDATKFVTQLVAGKQLYTEATIEEWMKPLVAGVMRTQLATRDVRSLMAERDAFVQACQAKLAELFSQWGFAFKHLELEEFNLPPEYRNVVQNVTLAGFKQQSALIEAQTRAQALQIEAQAQSNARLMTGTADVQIMALMQQQGLDPVKIQMVKALMEYAQSPSEGGGGGLISGDLYKPQVFAMLTQLLIDPVVPNDVKQTLRQNFPQQSSMVPQPIAPPTIAAPAPAQSSQPPQAPAAEAPLTAAKIQETLDNLDMQLAEGKLSEATYNRLHEKWEAKLRTLQAG
jgi:regulator of protease activity HflC (stomatin/prohibitin superfamily)